MSRYPGEGVTRDALLGTAKGHQTRKRDGRPGRIQRSWRVLVWSSDELSTTSGHVSFDGRQSKARVRILSRGAKVIHREIRTQTAEMGRRLRAPFGLPNGANRSVSHVETPGCDSAFYAGRGGYARDSVTGWHVRISVRQA